MIKGKEHRFRGQKGPSSDSVSTHRGAYASLSLDVALSFSAVKWE